MTWLFFVGFYLYTDGLSWKGWLAFGACVIWDYLKDRRDARRPQQVIIIRDETRP